MRTLGSVTDLQDLGNIVVRPDPNEPVRIGDIAELRFAGLTRYGGVTRDGQQEAVEGLVLGLRGANARAVVAGVKEKLAEIASACRKVFPSGSSTTGASWSIPRSPQLPMLCCRQWCW